MIEQLKVYVEKREGRLITATKNNRKQKWAKNNSMDVLSD